MQLATTGPILPAPAIQRKPLLWLGAAVLAVHLLVLQGAAFMLDTGAPPITRPFITRTVAATPEARPQPPAAKPAGRSPRAARHPAQVSAPVATGDPMPAAVAPTQAAPDTTSVNDNAVAPAAEAAASAPVAATADPAPVVAAGGPQVSVPGSLRLKYKIEGEIQKLTYHASGELLWLHDGKTYDARMEVGAFMLGSRVQTSSGRITPEGLAPTRFADKVRSEVAAHFERDKGKVVFSANTPDVELQPGAQDQLSIFVQLASQIAGDPKRYAKGSVFEIQAVGARDAETWRFVVDGEELLKLPGGEQAALKLTRDSQKKYDISVEVWLAPDLGYLPARIRLTQNNGDFIDQQLRSSETP